VAKRKDEISEAYSESYRRIAEVIGQIPRGKVMTYGQVAEDAGLGRAARLVGYALHAIGKQVPWQRVLGKRGKNIAQVAIKDPLHGTEQRLRLEREGVQFTGSGGVDLARYGFRLRRRAAPVRPSPRAPRAAARGKRPPR
jgi:methylated-DNA-protein-cysteine methyltransferase-like protein